MATLILAVLGCVVLLFVAYVVTQATRNLIETAKKFAERPAETLLATAIELKERSEDLGIKNNLLLTFFETFLQDVAQHLVVLAKQSPEALSKANALMEATESLKGEWMTRVRAELAEEIRAELLGSFTERENAITAQEAAIFARDQAVQEKGKVLEQQGQVYEQRRRNLEEVSRLIEDPAVAARMRMLEPHDVPQPD